jgi:hypothetical protein
MLQTGNFFFHRPGLPFFDWKVRFVKKVGKASSAPVLTVDRRDEALYTLFPN